jgi:hypothetical protein
MIPVGYVAVRTGSGRITLHLAAPPNGERTVCGRWHSADYLPEDEEIPDDARICQVDEAVMAGRQDQWKRRTDLRGRGAAEAARTAPGEPRRT